MIKKLAVFATLIISAQAANAECSIFYRTDTKTNIAFNKYCGWNFSAIRFNNLCEKLKRANAKLLISAESTVLANQSIGWASVSVMDRNLGIFSSDYGAVNTTVNSYASQDKADEIMVVAINSAVEQWREEDKALASLEAERKKVKAALNR